VIGGARGELLNTRRQARPETKAMAYKCEVCRVFVAGAVKCTLAGVPHPQSRHDLPLALTRHTSRTQTLIDLVESPTLIGPAARQALIGDSVAPASILNASEVPRKGGNEGTVGCPSAIGKR